MKYTDDEIIKALECHADADIKTCKICPYNDVSLCGYKLCSDALAIINRQQAEIERLNNNLSAMVATMRNSARATKADAIKEFAERLKARIDIWVFGYLKAEITHDIECAIDNLVQEMAGDAQ